ncbi:MAG: ATP-dependent Clp protease adaptor ClpS [Planctomycetaceae bacterium]|nr:ATP-dependent Clp protease adaptor ClpS [Planctomycetaceae bacterium]
MTVQQTADDVVVVTSRPAPDTKSKPKKQPPYAVIVENDDLHTYDYVIEAFSKVFGYSQEKSFQLARVIDTEGRALVWSGTKELAELKRDQIKGFGPDHYASKPVTFPLGVYIEPLP